MPLPSAQAICRKRNQMNFRKTSPAHAGPSITSYQLTVFALHAVVFRLQQNFLTPKP
jgi:hypothetical protein